MTTTELRATLSELQRQLQPLSEVEEPPLTTLQIIETNQQEKHWHRLLAYFLDPSEPHGLDDRLLQQFLDVVAASDQTGFTYSRLDLPEIEIAEEVGMETGRIDLLLWVPEEWFLCIELKVGATEGAEQTQRYVDADRFSGLDMAKTAFPADSHHYLYIAPDDAATAAAADFATLRWETIAAQIEAFLTTSHGRFPARTTTQLRDFTDTIQNKQMSDYEETQREKVELAVQYYEAIQEVTEAYEEYVKALRTRWPEWFFEQESFTGAPAEWISFGTGKVHRMLWKPGWALSDQEGGAAFRDHELLVYWECKIKKEGISEGRFVHQITGTAQEQALMEAFQDAIYNEGYNRRLDSALEELNGAPGKQFDVPERETEEGNDQQLIQSTYEFDMRDGKGFEQTAVEAFTDLKPVFDLIDDSIPER